MYVSVVVDVSSSNVDQFYEYHVPEVYNDYVNVGERVKVTFGSDKIIMGYIIEVYEETRFEGSKDIIELVDYHPVITLKQLELAAYLKNEYICPLIRILNLMIPDAMHLKSNKYLEVINFDSLDARIAPLFKNSKVIMYNNELAKDEFIKKEIKNGNLSFSFDAKQRTSYKYEKRYYLNKSLIGNINNLKSLAQRELLLNYPSESTSIVELIEKFDISVYQIKSLIKKGFLTETKVMVSRIKQTIINYEETNFEYNKEIEKIKNHDKPYLYVSSDKEEENNTILSLIKRTLEENKNIVVFTPTILESINYSSLIRHYLKVDCAVLNSSLSSGEYLDYYTSIKNNEYRIIVSTNKGLLLPYENVGLYIVTSEDADQYYNDQSPRYDLKEVVKERSKQDDAILVYFSLNPNVTSYLYAAKNIMYLIDHVNENKPLNKVVIDMVEELKNGNNSYISSSLKKAINESLLKNKPSLLIVNNKNYASSVICRTCGKVIVCDKCDVAMQYNEKRKAVVCPECGKFYSFNLTCPKCSSTNLIFNGVGIEQINDLISKEFKNAFIIKYNELDLNDYSSLVSELDEKNVDILITTGTYAKALPLKQFETIGIINVDSSLKSPRFDTNSYVYNMLSNLDCLLNKNGKMYIQTLNPENELLKHFVSGSYHSFIKDEINVRKLSHNEPFVKVNRIIVKAGYNDMFVIANNIKKTLKEISKEIFIIGPTYSKKMGGAVLIIKHNNKNITNIYKKIYEVYQNNTATIIFDRHPRSL